MPRPLSRTVRTVLAGAFVGLLTLTGLSVLGGPAQAAPARTGNVVTPGNFTGYGFDQCLAPSQTAMDRWLQSSPFLAVGIYISGDSRGCRYQPNLTTTWIHTQLARGWRLLPITLGPQASCLSRYPRYGDDKTIISKPGTSNRYSKAMSQGRAEARTSVGVASGLGITAGSTLWYDLEGFDSTRTRCRESALSFLSGWSVEIRKLGYKSGVYSSAGSGMAALDDARVNRPGRFHLPDQIWIARWDGVANTSTSYLRSDGWQPHARVKQYQGGHDEKWGGVTINIDRNYLDVGRGSVAAAETRCGGVQLNFSTYDTIRAPRSSNEPQPPASRVQALQCLLKEQGFLPGQVTGNYGTPTIRAVRRFQAAHQITVRDAWSRKNWMIAHTEGLRPVLKTGSAGSAVRRLQRALNSTGAAVPVKVTGVFGAGTDKVLRTWQGTVGVEVSGVAGSQTWSRLRTGVR